jgi:pimeloyl-ACP methyl ester carboxylesterase
MLMLHATGMHGWVFRPLAASLTDHFHCWALDLRGHGDSGFSADETFNWGHFAQDVLAAALYLRGDGDDVTSKVTGFGHSLGGAALVLAAQLDPFAFERLVLYEPALMPPGHSTASGFIDEQAMMVAGAKRRRATFSSYADALSNYASKAPMSAFGAAALHAYVQHGFAADPDGSVTLKCQPEVEAASFAKTQSQEEWGTWRGLEALACPVHLLGGTRSGGNHAQTASEAATVLGVSVVELAGLEHFGPLQLPGYVAEIIARQATPVAGLSTS